MRVFFQNRLLVELIFGIATFTLPAFLRFETFQFVAFALNGFYLVIFIFSILSAERGNSSDSFKWRFPMVGLVFSILFSGNLVDYENWLSYDALIVWIIGLIIALSALTYASLRLRGYIFKLNKANLLGLTFILLPYSIFTIALIDILFLESKVVTDLKVQKAYPDAKPSKRHHAILKQSDGKIVHIRLPLGKKATEIGTDTLLRVTISKGILGGLRVNAH